MYLINCFFYSVFHFIFIFYFFLLSSDLIWVYEWGLMNNLHLKFYFLLDYMSLGFLAFVSFISLSVMSYSKSYMETGPLMKRFLVLVNLFVLSMFLLISSSSLFSMMLGWDGLGVTSFLLVVFYNNFSSLKSGLLTIYMNRLGDFFMVMSFYLMYKEATYNLSISYLSFWVYMFVMVGMAAMTKSAQLPFSSWLPAAMAAPTPVSSLVHSSTLVTAGVYMMLRFFYFFESYSLMILLCYFSIATSLGSGLIACYENDLKKMVAMSTLSQLGLMIFVFSLGEMFYSFFHMVCHALFKALLFLSCGIFILSNFGLQDMRMYLSSFSTSFLVLAMMVVSIFSLLGFPFLAGFYSKDSILEVYLLLSPLWLVFMFLFIVCLLTGIYGLKALIIMLKSSVSGGPLFSFSLVKMDWVGMSFLGLWAIVLGKILSQTLLVLEWGYSISLDKLLGLVVVLLGGFLAFMVFWTILLFKWGFSFFGEMFFLNLIFGFYSSQNLKSFFASVAGDKLWMALFGSSGFYSLLLTLGSANVNFSFLGKVSLFLLLLVGVGSY